MKFKDKDGTRVCLGLTWGVGWSVWGHFTSLVTLHVSLKVNVSTGQQVQRNGPIALAREETLGVGIQWQCHWALDFAWGSNKIPSFPRVGGMYLSNPLHFFFVLNNLLIVVWLLRYLDIQNVGNIPCNSLFASLFHLWGSYLYVGPVIFCGLTSPPVSSCFHNFIYFLLHLLILGFFSLVKCLRISK